MRKTMKLELCRGFYNRTFVLTLLLGAGLSLYHTFEFVLPNMIEMECNELNGNYPLSIFNQWIGGEGFSLQASLFNLLFPCIAILPYAESLFSDIRSGYIKQMLTKVSRKEFLSSRVLAVFLTGGSAYIIPLLFNLFSTALIVPALMPEVSCMQFPVTESSMFSQLFYHHPYGYIFIYLVIDFLFAGLFACLGMCLAFFVENRTSIFIIPFAVYMISFFIMDLFEKPWFAPRSFVRISQPINSNFNIIVIEFVVGLGIVLWVYFRKGKAYEIY